MNLSSLIDGSIKKDTGISTISPGSKNCSSKQKHSILLKYLAACRGVTLKLAVPLIGIFELFEAL